MRFAVYGLVHDIVYHVVYNSVYSTVDSIAYNARFVKACELLFPWIGQVPGQVPQTPPPALA
jgi:hypothetical protein